MAQMLALCPYSLVLCPVHDTQISTLVKSYIFKPTFSSTIGRVRIDRASRPAGLRESFTTISDAFRTGGNFFKNKVSAFQVGVVAFRSIGVYLIVNGLLAC